MTEWALVWGAAAVVASVLVARWYGRSWRAVAEALAQRGRDGSQPSPEAPAGKHRTGRMERVGAQ